MTHRPHRSEPPPSGTFLRPLVPEDADRLRAFFITHTPETILMRYGYPVKEMTEARARQLVSVDPTRDAVWGAFQKASASPVDELVGVGRFYGDQQGAGAEFALVVAESARRQGIAQKLLRELRKNARQLGLSHLWGNVRSDNLPMKALMKKNHARRISAEDGEIIYRLDLTKTPPTD